MRYLGMTILVVLTFTAATSVVSHVAIFTGALARSRGTQSVGVFTAALCVRTARAGTAQLVVSDWMRRRNPKMRI